MQPQNLPHLVTSLLKSRFVACGRTRLGAARSRRNWALVMGMCVTAALTMAGCSGDGAQTPDSGDPSVIDGPAGDNDGNDSTSRRTRPRLDISRVGAFDVRPYSGRHAADARLIGHLKRLGEAGTSALARAADEAGLEPSSGRGPLLQLTDELVGGGALRVDLRLVSGVRRPVIRMDTNSLLAGEIAADSHFAAAVVEAVLVGAFGDREAPAWLRAGLGPVLVESDTRLLHERALSGPWVRRQLSELLPADPDDPLRASLRLRTLLRIGRGENPLARFVGVLRNGGSLSKALAVVGVDDPLFLEAAEESTQRNLATQLEEDPLLAALGTARALLAARDAEGAGKALPADEEGVTTKARHLIAERRLTRAEILLAQGDAASALAVVEPLLVSPDALLRVRVARSVRARSALLLSSQSKSGRERAHAALLDLLRLHPDAPELSSLLSFPPTKPLSVDALRALGSADVDVRRPAVLRLANHGGAAQRTIELFLSDADSGVRAAALTALARVAPRDAGLELTVAASDADPGIRLHALTTLAEVDPALARNVAKDKRNDGNAAVRTLARRLAGPETPPKKTPPKKDKPKSSTVPAKSKPRTTPSTRGPAKPPPDVRPPAVEPPGKKPTAKPTPTKTPPKAEPPVSDPPKPGDTPLPPPKPK